MTEQLEFMRPPDGEVIRSTVVFSRRTFNHQKRHSDKGWINGPVNEKQNRVLRKDILWSPRPGGRINRNERAAVHGDVAAFSVLNGIGVAGWTKATFLSKYYFIGLSTSTMESNAINTDAGIYSAVDRQGLTWLRNTGPVTIQVGDLVMAELPDGTIDAERLFPETAITEGGTPSRRYTAYPKTWSVGTGILVSAIDVNKGMRRNPLLGAPTMPGTSGAVRDALRNLMAAALIATRIAPRAFVDRANLTAIVTAAAAGGALGGIYNELARIRNGDRDQNMAALLFPTAGEFLVPGGRLRADANDTAIQIHNIQTGGYEALITALYGSIQETGANRIMGRAVSGALPGEVMSILLFG